MPGESDQQALTQLQRALAQPLPGGGGPGFRVTHPRPDQVTVDRPDSGGQRRPLKRLDFARGGCGAVASTAVGAMFGIFGSKPQAARRGRCRLTHRGRCGCSFGPLLVPVAGMVAGRRLHRLCTADARTGLMAGVQAAAEREMDHCGDGRDDTDEWSHTRSFLCQIIVRCGRETQSHSATGNGLASFFTPCVAQSAQPIRLECLFIRRIRNDFYHRLLAPQRFDLLRVPLVPK